MTPEQVPVPDGRAGLLLSRDLIFTTKITGTATALGLRVVSAGNLALATAMLERWQPALVIVDLGAGELVSPANLASLRALAPQTPFLAFGSHVDTEALAAASAAGCDPVLPRSRFTTELPDILGRYLNPV